MPQKQDRGGRDVRNGDPTPSTRHCDSEIIVSQPLVVIASHYEIGVGCL